MKRPFARMFDLIQAEYGWTDDTVLDLTLARMQQISDVILIRQRSFWRREVNLQEAKIRHTVAAVHGAAGNKSGMQAAQEIRFIDEDKKAKKKIPSIAKVSQFFAVDPEYGLYSEEDIAAAAEKMKADGRL